MAITQGASRLVQQLRCGDLVGRDVLVSGGIKGADVSRNALFLLLPATDKEIAALVSRSAAPRTRLTVLPSAAGVMYVVLSIQVGPTVWRHVVPIWDEQGRRWLEDCVRQQRISVACGGSDSDHLTVLQWMGAIPHPEALLRLTCHWPALEDEAKASDFAEMVDALSAVPAIQPPDAAFEIEEVQVVTHSPWLLTYLQHTSFPAEPHGLN